MTAVKMPISRVRMPEIDDWIQQDLGLMQYDYIIVILWAKELRQGGERVEREILVLGEPYHEHLNK